MGLDLTLIPCLGGPEYPRAFGRLPLDRNELIEAMRESFAPGSSRVIELPAPLQMQIRDPKSDGGLYTANLTHDPYGRPLTYIGPELLNEFVDEWKFTSDMNQAAIDYCRFHTFRRAVIIVLHWE